jgi:hypothetical protein
METELTVKRIWIDGQSSKFYDDLPRLVKEYKITPQNIISVVHEGRDVVIYYWGTE